MTQEIGYTYIFTPCLSSDRNGNDGLRWNPRVSQSIYCRTFMMVLLSWENIEIESQGIGAKECLVAKKVMTKCKEILPPIASTQ